MSYTFGDQQNKLSSLVGDPNTTTSDMFPQAQRLKELNRGELQFAVDAKDLREYATGTISNLSVIIPSDFIELFVLIVTTSSSQMTITPDREVSLKDWERYYRYNSDRPWVYQWEFSGSRTYKLITTTAINGLSYFLYYFKKPTTELALTTDVSLHREEFREAPVFYAAAQLMQQIGKYTQAQQFMSEYQGYVDRAKMIVGKEYIDAEHAVPDFGFSSTVLTDTQGHGYIG